MGWKKNRKKGELAFEGGFFGLPLINELSRLSSLFLITSNFFLFDGDIYIIG